MQLVVAFVSQKGGVGKSTLARALAAVAAHGGLKVLLADLDRAQRTLLHWYERKTGKMPPRITVGAFTDAAEALAAAGKSDLVILDTPGHVDASTLAIAKSAHVIVLPTGPSVDDLHPTVLLLHELLEAGIARSRIVAALCRVLLDDEETAARSYLEEAGCEVLAGSIPEDASYRIAQNTGHSLTETTQRSLNERADALMEALLTKIGTLANAKSEEDGIRKKGGAA